MADISSSSCFLLLFHLVCVSSANPQTGIPPIFIFGDSTADVGTNNFLFSSLSIANFPYNGIDFPHSLPTGRFSNGLNTLDHIAKLFGYKSSPPPFFSLASRQDSFRRKILRGVNFASGGSGILNTTGRQRFVEVVSLEVQIQQFRTVRQNIRDKLGREETANFLSKSLFFVSVGSNDIMDFYNSSATQTSKQDFLLTLQSTYQFHLKNLYNMGARRFGILSVPPIGCCPAVRVTIKNGDCDEELNEFARPFYVAVNELLQRLSSKLEGMIYSLGNSFDMTIHFMKNPSAFGIKNLKTACCGKEVFGVIIPCMRILKPDLCANRSEYLFWDSYHPTEFASQLAASTFYGGELKFVAPVNFSQLLAPEI